MSKDTTAGIAASDATAEIQEGGVSNKDRVVTGQSVDSESTPVASILTATPSQN